MMNLRIRRNQKLEVNDRHRRLPPTLLSWHVQHFLPLWTVSGLTLALYVFLHEHVLAIEDGVGELPYPVSEYHHAGLAAQHQVEFYVAVSVDEVVDVRMCLHVLLSIHNEELLLLSHVRSFLAVSSLEPRVLCPVQSELHSPPWVNEVEQPLAEVVVETFL